MKRLPPEMKAWFFPFNWNVKELWALEGRIERRTLKDLKWHLEVPFWSSERGKVMLFDLTPKEVLDNPVKHSYHSNRIREANIAFPICLTEYKGREIIIDGIHRLAKLASQNKDELEVKVIDGASIETIAKYE